MGEAERSNRGEPLWAVQEILVPVLSGLLAPDEVESIQVARTHDGRLELHLSVGGESGVFYLWAPDWSPESDGDVRRRLASELQDFIAESRFAWGEQRTYEEI